MNLELNSNKFENLMEQDKFPSSVSDAAAIVVNRGLTHAFLLNIASKGKINMRMSSYQIMKVDFKTSDPHENSTLTASDGKVSDYPGDPEYRKGHAGRMDTYPGLGTKSASRRKTRSVWAMSNATFRSAFTCNSFQANEIS